MLKENGLLIFLIILIFGLGLGMKFFSETEVESNQETSPSPVELDFEKEGNIVQQDGKWILVYEEPGAPALTAVLEFNENGSFDFKNFKQGMRVKVTGEKTDNKVEVSQLTIVE
jgi:hypothetical protein